MHVRKHYSHLRQRLSAKGTKEAKFLLKRLSGKETLWMTDINHNISRKIVDSCKSGKFGDSGDILVLEELKHIRDRIKLAKKQRQIQHSWAFGQLQTFIEYKALEKGIPVVYVAPQYTSQKCPVCGHIEKSNRNGHRFCCVRCNYKAHADFVSPLNIRQASMQASIGADGWAVVNQPIAVRAESLTTPSLGTAS